MSILRKENKGQKFVESNSMKGKGVEKNLETLNTTMSNFSVKNLKSLQNFSNSMQNSNSNLIKLNFSNLKVMDVLVKKIEILNHNINLSTKHSEKQRDFVRREDPNLKLYKAVDDLEDLMKENNKIQKEKNEKGGILSLIAGIGSILGLGGIVAGAGEAIKAFSLSVLTKVPLLGAIISIPLAISKFKKGDTVGGLIDLATGVSTLIPGFGIPIAIALQGYQFFRSKKDSDYKEKEAKIAIPILTTALFLKIPILGALISIPLAIKAFKSGDTVGGLIDLGTGAASLFPGIGTAIAIALQGYKIFRNVKGNDYKEKEGKVLKTVGIEYLKNLPLIGTIWRLVDSFKAFKNKEYGKAFVDIGHAALTFFPGLAWGLSAARGLWEHFKVGEKIESFVEEQGGTGEVLKTIGIEVLKSLPGIGTFMHFKEGCTLWKTDKLGAMKEFALGLTSVVPGANLIISPILGFIENFIKSKGGLTEVASNVMQSASDIIQNPLGAASNLVEGAASGAVGLVKGAASGVSSFFGKTKDKILDKAVSMSSNLYDMSEDFLTESTGSMIGSEQEADEKGEGWFTFKKWKPKLQGLKPKVWNNFQQMAKEYKAKTGKSIQINSAVRGGKGSLHNVGYAIDINSDNANELENLGLMKTYGFHRPLLNWEKKRETWHIEPYPGKNYGPRDTNNYPIRSAAAKGKGELDFGGDILNLPNQIIADKYKSDNMNNKIELSDSTIQAIANAIGSSFRNSIPKTVTNRVNINTNMRG